jgi:hypothetical protein
MSLPPHSSSAPRLRRACRGLQCTAALPHTRPPCSTAQVRRRTARTAGGRQSLGAAVGTALTRRWPWRGRAAGGPGTTWWLSGLGTGAPWWRRGLARLVMLKLWSVRLVGVLSLSLNTLGARTAGLMVVDGVVVWGRKREHQANITLGPRFLSWRCVGATDEGWGWCVGPGRFMCAPVLCWMHTQSGECCRGLPPARSSPCRHPTTAAKPHNG